MPNQLDVISVLFFCKKSLLARHAFALFERTTSWRASVASETVLGVDNAKSGICYWRASVASETLTGVTQSKIGDVYLFICIYVWTYVCHFVL